MGVNPTAWGYSPYDEIIKKLVAHGIPREQIAAIGDAESDAKKQALFEKVRQGSVRVLIGSTQKMGTGTNVQKRLVALHHLDAPWKPAEVEQRDGRILRQGNENKEVAIYRYVTEGSFDAYMWQALETKARFISPGHHRRQRRPPCRGHRRPGTLLRRGQGDRVGQPGGADARRGRRRAATAQPCSRRTTSTSNTSPAAASAICRRPSPACPSGCPSSPRTRPPRTTHADDPITIGRPHLLTRRRTRHPRRQARRLAEERPRDDPRSARHLPGPAFRHGASPAIPARRLPGRRDHPPVHAVARPPGAACRPERPGTPGRRLRLRMRPRPARPRHRRIAASRLPGPPGQAVRCTTPTCPN